MVPTSESAPIDWVALRGWYVVSDEVLRIFDRCCDVARTLLNGESPATLREATQLGALTAQADEWLVGHPCPHESNGAWVTSIAQLFALITNAIVVRQGLGLAHDGVLRSMIDDACDTVTEFRGLVLRVASAPSR